MTTTVPAEKRIDPAEVSLRPITADTVLQVIGLQVNPSQERFVASNAVSLAQALFAPEAWYRAIYVDDTPAGFVMLADYSQVPDAAENPEVYIWRFMVDHGFQKTGVGAAALEKVIEHVRATGRFEKLSVTYMPGEGSAEMFYLRAGFQHTGRMDEDEIILELRLDSQG